MTRIQDDGGVPNSGSDTTLLSSASTVKVKAVNDAPTIVAPVTLTTDEDKSVYLVAGSSSEVSFADVDAFSSDVKATLTTKNGRLFIDGGDASVSASGAHESWTYVVQGEIGDVNDALDGIEFRPTAQYYGATTIDIEIDDLGNTGIGGNLTATQTINIDIASVEDVPVLFGKSFVLTTYEDEHIINHEIGLTEFDPENVKLYFSAEVLDTAYTPIESVELIKVGGQGDNYHLSVYVKPDSHGVGRIKLLYGDDNHDLEYDISVIVEQVDDTPVIVVPDTIVANSVSGIQLLAAIYDNDTASSSLVVSAVSEDNDIITADSLAVSRGDGGYTITGGINSGAFGEATLVVQASDGSSTVTKTVLVKVEDTNAAPAIEAPQLVTGFEDMPLEFTVGLTDDTTEISQLEVTIEGDSASIIDWAKTSISSIEGGAKVVLVPLANRSGEGSLTVSVSDGESDSATAISYKVVAANDPPSLTTIKNISLYSGDAIVIGIEVSDIDSNVDDIDVVVDSSTFIDASVISIGAIDGNPMYAIQLEVDENIPTMIAQFSVYATDGEEDTDTQVVNVFIQDSSVIANKDDHDLDSVASRYIDIDTDQSDDNSQAVLKIRSINKITAIEADVSSNGKLGVLAPKAGQQPIVDQNGTIVLPIDKTKPYGFWIIEKQ